jgi:hypothetical protein
MKNENPCLRKRRMIEKDKVSTIAPSFIKRGWGRFYGV